MKHKYAFLLLLVPALLTLCVTVRASAALCYPGDVNLDDVVTVSDGVLIARAASEDKRLTLSDRARDNADINRNGRIDTNDLTLELKSLSGSFTLPEPYEETTTTTTETTTTTTETTPTTTTTTTETTTTTTTTTTETTTTTTTTTAEPGPGNELVADSRSYPLGVSMSVLSGKQAPVEMLTVQYQMGNMTFAIFAENPAETTIAIACDDKLVGYYTFCSSYENPDTCRVTEYKDSFSGDKTYAILAMCKGYSIHHRYVMDKNSFEVMAKLNFYATNAIRAINQLPPLTWDAELAKVAAAHSRDMAENNYFDHTSLDGRTPGNRLDDAGIDWATWGENVDAGYEDAFAALNGWYNSKSGHRDNLLSTSFSRVGVGFAYNENSHYGFYGTQDFYLDWDTYFLG